MEKCFTPIVISGPSGVGKGTLLDMLFKEFAQQFSFSISCTTRQPRASEQHGVNYYFITQEEFQQKVEQNQFLENAQVHKNFYGTLKSELTRLKEQGKICILEIDIQGAKQIAAKYEEAVNFIFIAPPEMQALESRLKQRGTENQELIQLRLRDAEVEMKEMQECGIYKHVIVNDVLQETYQKLKDLLKQLYPAQI